MDMPMELMALNVTPQGALLRWTSPLSNVDNYVLTLTRSQGRNTNERGHRKKEGMGQRGDQRKRK